MPEIARRRFLTLAGGSAVALSWAVTDPVLADAIPQRSTALPPQTIPAIRQWNAGTGQYQLPATIRILISPTAFRSTADTFAEDLRKLTKKTVTVVVQSTPVPVAGDIVLTQATVTGGAEAYELIVSSWLEVRGPKSGVFFGTRTILQWLRQATTIPAGTAIDYPTYPERGFLVANAPKRYTETWWQGQIQEMSYLKLNMLWLYVGYDTTPLPEMKRIAEYAAKYNIAVVPQSNMPGHMTKLLADRPDLGLPGRAEALDLSKPAAYDFARGIVSPLLSEFDTPHWHLGVDEYLVDFGGDFPVRYDQHPRIGDYAKQRFGSQAVPADALYGFVNDLNQTVRASGKTMRIWNDGLLTSGTVPVNTNVVVEHWVHWPGRKTPQQLLASGYKLSNSNGDFLYYDPGTRRPEPAPIYQDFNPGVFSGNQIVAKNTPGLLGAKLHLWTLPDVETEEYQSDQLLEPFRALAQVLWDTPRHAATYAEFVPLITTIGRPPNFPAGRHTVSPVDGATSVWPHRPIKVQFYDKVVPSSVQLAEGGTEAGTPGRFEYNETTNTATFTPTNPWPYNKQCQARLLAKDSAGNQIQHSWTFKTALRPSLAYPRSLWPDEEGPAVERYSDGQPVELGVKFRVDRPGVVQGVKFYKSPNDFGRHTGSLWAADGRLLATATFGEGTAAGWQEVKFSSPVPVVAGTTYVASYNTADGVYGFNYDFFAGRGIDNGVLHALPDSNGVSAYGTGVFPTEVYRNTNYWADVIFQPDTYTLWDVQDAPVFGATEPTSLELGVRFHTQKVGKVHGIRFFKGTHNTGTHIGSLWSAGGTKLASATFTGESASGWQEVRFANPVTIAAGENFIASYSSPTGAFSATENGLAVVRNNGALSTDSGPNGLFAVAQGTFPTQSYQARNYFTDVVFAEV
jgi:hypothetical protein